MICNQPPSSAEPLFAGEPISLNTYKDQAYNLIKDAILYGKMNVGTVYSQDGICANLQISRTPVREALLELQKEGYIKILRGRGIEVVSISEEDACNIVEMRCHNEFLGAFLASQRRTYEQLEKIELALNEMISSEKTGDKILMYRLDRAFHHAVFVAAGNDWLLKTNEQLRDQFLRAENQEAFRFDLVVKEHSDVLLAIKNSDSAMAIEAMHCHMRGSIERTLAHMIKKPINITPILRKFV